MLSVGLLLMPLLVLIHDVHGAGRAFPIESENYISEKFRTINPQINWDDTNFLVDLAGWFTNCNNIRHGYEDISNRRMTRGRSIIALYDNTHGEGTDWYTVNSYIKLMVDSWMDDREHRSMIRGADTFGCSVRPGCLGSHGDHLVTVVCLFSHSPLYKDWNPVPTRRPTNPVTSRRPPPTSRHRPRPRPTYRPKPRPTHRPKPRPTHRPKSRPTHRPKPRPTHRPRRTHRPRPTHRPKQRPTHRPKPRPTSRPTARPRTPYIFPPVPTKIIEHKGQAFTNEQYLLAEHITANKWDRSHFLENLSGYAITCSMIYEEVWPFVKSTALGRQYGLSVKGVKGESPNKGSTQDAMEIILNRFKYIPTSSKVGCSVIPDCISVQGQMWVIVTCIYEAGDIYYYP